MATYQNARFRNKTKTSGRLSGAIPFHCDVAFTAALAANDLLKGTKLPKGAILMSPASWYIQSADYDTSTNLTLTLRVTDGTIVKNIISASAVAQSTGIRVNGDGTGLVTGWAGYELPNDNFYVEVLVAAGPSTSTSGTISFGGLYTMNDTSK